MRVKIIKNYKDYRKGQVVQVSPNEAHGLIDGGYGIVSTAMDTEDYKQSGIKAKKVK